MDLKPKRIAFLLFDECDLLDTAGPAAVFDSAGRALVRRGATRERPIELLYFSSEGGLVTTRQGLPVLTSPLPTPARGAIDTVIVVGGTNVDESSDPRLVAWLRQHHHAFRRIASVCTGSFILALAGLLDGRRAVTHWADCAELQRSFPSVKVNPDCIFTEDGGVWTSAGVSTGIDLALAMLEQDYGHELALTVARSLVLYLKRPGGQTQFSTALRGQAVTGPLAPLLKWIADNPSADLRAETLAERAHMSLRNFYRAFVDATGAPPAEWVEAVRLEVAKRLLEQTSRNADQVAFQSGFGSYERMRRTFTRRLGVSPAAYRTDFSKVLDAPGGAFYFGALDPAASATEEALLN
jgi:transcriptional regulator GlxA family with amidase domain